MEKSNGTKIAVGIVVFSLFIYSIYVNQIVLAQELELKSVGKRTITCDGGEEVNGVRINFLCLKIKEHHLRNGILIIRN